MVLDGVIDPAAYTSANQSVGDLNGPASNAFLRIESDEGSARAFESFIRECAAAGPERCAFAAPTAAATRAKFDTLLTRLRATPMEARGPAGTLTVTYSVVVEAVRGALYSASSWAGLADGLQRLVEGDAAGFLAATNNLGGPSPTVYQNPREGQQASNCLDGAHPKDPATFAQMVKEAEARTPYFGAAWAYLSEPCVFWQATDADRYTGPWNAETSTTILLVSRVYDPATPHASAVAASRTLGNAELLTIDGWGHSYFEGGLSTCANTYMAAYLIDRALPPPNTICAEDVAPFSAPGKAEAGPATPIP